MGYRDIYKESNEQAEERFLLVMERIAEIAEETDVPRYRYLGTHGLTSCLS